MKLTEKVISGLVCPPSAKDRMVFDEVVPGLAVRVSQSGAKAFLAQFTVAGRKRRVPLGRWGSITLEQARVATRSVLGDVARGLDPAAKAAAARSKLKAEAKAEKLTLEVLIGQWEKLALAVRRESYRREAIRAIRFAYEGHLKKPADSLTRDDALRPLDRLVKSGKEAIAGRTLAYGRACYRWAQRRGMVEGSPFDGLPIAAGTVSRDRVLTDEEVALVWQHADGLGAPFAALFRILLLTGQRRDEVGGMRWEELSEDRSVWTIPKERAKNGKGHIVHIAPAVRAALATVPRMENTDLVFTTTGKTPVSGFTRAKDRLDEAIAKARGGKGEPRPLPGWRLHDFRRTVVTWMAANGIAPHVADRLLNHTQGTISGVAAVYQRGEFLAERRAALDAWASHVTSAAEENERDGDIGPSSVIRHGGSGQAEGANDG